jgi:hypothetical protein
VGRGRGSNAPGTCSGLKHIRLGTAPLHSSFHGSQTGQQVTSPRCLMRFNGESHDLFPCSSKHSTATCAGPGIVLPSCSQRLTDCQPDLPMRSASARPCWVRPRRLRAFLSSGGVIANKLGAIGQPNSILVEASLDAGNWVGVAIIPQPGYKFRRLARQMAQDLFRRQHEAPSRLRRHCANR